MMTLAEVDALAGRAHAGQTDKTGVPYVEHVRAVAAGLAPLGPHLAMAGLLHDIVEDTDWTPERLRAAGIPDRVVDLVVAVTNTPGTDYEEKIHRITRDPEATLVKIADNAHNSRTDRSAALPPAQRDRLAAKYRAARAVLWAAADPERIATVLRIVNPDLLAELPDPCDARHRNPLREPDRRET
ncbi:HD domain-containing protein [Streptomyces sp. NPDC015492]|uniref:HD domain-containing protein n=1 Tax=Streptomyces sp. NPDC015492 TaxID=3364958 RepID=UPI0037012726